MCKRIFLQKEYTIEDYYVYYNNIQNGDTYTNLSLPSSFTIKFGINNVKKATSQNVAFLRFNTATGDYVGKPSSERYSISINSVHLHNIESYKDYDYVLTYDNGVATLSYNETSISSEITLTSLVYITSTVNTKLNYVKIII